MYWLILLARRILFSLCVVHETVKRRAYIVRRMIGSVILNEMMGNKRDNWNRPAKLLIDYDSLRSLNVSIIDGEITSNMVSFRLKLAQVI